MTEEVKKEEAKKTEDPKLKKPEPIKRVSPAEAAAARAAEILAAKAEKADGTLGEIVGGEDGWTYTSMAVPGDKALIRRLQVKGYEEVQSDALYVKGSGVKRRFFRIPTVIIDGMRAERASRNESLLRPGPSVPGNIDHEALANIVAGKLGMVRR